MFLLRNKKIIEELSSEPHFIWSYGSGKLFNLLYTGRLFQCYMLDESICHFRGVWSFLFYFLWKIWLANTLDSDQMPHYVVSDLGLHCLPMTVL